MIYNIHPIFVHFPIALLFAYSLVKIVPFQTWFPRVAWRDIERALLVIGVLGAFAGLATGEGAEHLARPNRALVELHAGFAATATWIYAILLAGECAAIIRTSYMQHIQKYPFVITVLSWIESIVCNKAMGIVLACAGLIAISVTGMLGGAMVYGTTADPLTAGLLNLFGITL